MKDKKTLTVKELLDIAIPEAIELGSPRVDIEHFIFGLERNIKDIKNISDVKLLANIELILKEFADMTFSYKNKDLVVQLKKVYGNEKSSSIPEPSYAIGLALGNIDTTEPEITNGFLCSLFDPKVLELCEKLGKTTLYLLPMTDAFYERLNKIHALLDYSATVTPELETLASLIENVDKVKANDNIEENNETGIDLLIREVGSPAPYINTGLWNNKTATIINLLLSDTTNAVIIDGEVGVGKDTIVKTIAEKCRRVRQKSDRVMLTLYEINDIELGYSWTENKLPSDLNRIYEYLANQQNPVLVIRNVDVPSMMYRGLDTLLDYVERGLFKLIIINDKDETTENILGKSKLTKTAHRITITEMDREYVVGILKNEVRNLVKNKCIESHSSDVVDYIIDEGNKYYSRKANPLRSIELLDNVANMMMMTSVEHLDKNVVDKWISYDLGFEVHSDRLSILETELNKNILGQGNALEEVIDNLRGVEYKLNMPNKPLVSMMFTGPSGVGKTETCKLIAKHYIGRAETMLFMDMTQFSSDMGVSDILGSNKGYVGYGQDTKLVAHVKKYPYSVIVFDEIEKASKKVHDTILTILDEGKATTPSGDTLSFENTIIIFTSNAWEDGQGKISLLENEESTEKDIKTALKETFTNRFMGRIDAVIGFKSLDNKTLKSHITTIKNKLVKQSTIPFKVKFTKEDIEDIINRANVKYEGARNLERIVKRKIIDLIKLEHNKEGK